MELYRKPMHIELQEKTLSVDGKTYAPSVRTLGAMEDVFASPRGDKDHPLYYMYRAVCSRNTLRYDITHIPPFMVNSEYAKTYGHYHPRAPDGVAYPEVYQVLSGSARFILQKKNKGGSVSVLVTSAEEKDTVLFPPEYGHVSVNPGKKDLILANIVSDSFESDYSDFKKLHGAACYYTEKGIVKNKNYAIDSIEQLSAQQLNARYDFSCEDLLIELYQKPETFDFLENPQAKFKK